MRELMSPTLSAQSTISYISTGNLLPLDRFLLALKAQETRRQYPKKLESFFDFLQMEGTLEQKTILFYSRVKTLQDSEWITNELLKFLSYQKCNK